MKSSPISFVFGALFLLIMLIYFIADPQWINFAFSLLVFSYTSIISFSKNDLGMQRLKEKIKFEKNQGKSILIAFWVASLLGVYTYFQNLN
jgi:hypothetical protein